MAQTQIDGRKPSKGVGTRRESRSGKKGQKACRSVLKGKCTNLSCDNWHPPYVKITYLNRDANSATNVCFDTLRPMGSQVKSRREVVGRISCLGDGDQTIGLRVPRCRATEEVYSTTERKIGIKLHRHTLQGHVAPLKKSGKTGSIARSYSKV